MGFYTQVQVVAEKKAFEMLKPIFERHWKGAEIAECDSYGTFSLGWVKWYPDFEQVQEVENVLKDLCSDELNEKEGYGFKMILLNENDTHEETYNNRGYGAFCDLTIRV